MIEEKDLIFPDLIFFNDYAGDFKSYFKAVYDANTGESGAYWVANDATKNYKMLSIAELTKTAGIDPFPSISQFSKNSRMALPQP